MIEGKQPYQGVAVKLLNDHRCVVRKITKNGGLAYTGDARRRIEVPHPTGPVSFGILAHEVGHQALHGLGVRTPLPRGVRRRTRWLEEMEAWAFALDAFEDFDLPGRGLCERRAERNLGYAVDKALRRVMDEDDLPRIYREVERAAEHLALGSVIPWDRIADTADRRRHRLALDC